MPTPTEIILDHLADVTAALSMSGPTAAYQRLPALHDSIPINIFRVTAPIVIATVQWLHNQTSNPQAEFTALRVKLAETEKQRDEAIAALPAIHDRVQPPKTFQGWNVQVGRDGYTRLYKKRHGAVLCEYLGKGWDETKAATKINERMKNWITT